jgi:hypothetical protein
VHADEALEEFKQCQPQAITHIRRTASKAEDAAYQQMSSDALCTTLPYFELEGLIPYHGPAIAAPATVGSGYSPTKAHCHAAWVATWKGLNCREPSSWKTPSLTLLQSPTPPKHLDICYTFKVQQNLIDPMFILRSCLAQLSGGPAPIPICSWSASPHSSDDSFEAPSPQPFYIMSHNPAITTNPLAIPIPHTESISPIPVPP